MGKRVLLACTNGGGLGGTERVVCNLARGLRQRGHAVKVVFGQVPGLEDLKKWFDGQGVPMELHPAVGCEGKPGRFKRISLTRQLLRDERPDVINLHTGGCRLSSWDALLLGAGGRPVVFSTHHPYPFGRWDRRLRTVLGALCVKAVTVTTPMQARHLMDAGVPERKLRVVPLGVNVETPSAARQVLRREWDLPEDACVIAGVGRLVKGKGFLDLIEATGGLLERFPKLHLVIAGAPAGDEGAIRSAATAKLGDRVRFFQAVRRVADVYTAADLFALPSHDEGFGLVYLEAARFGLPAVACDVGGVPFAVVDGRTGLLVPPHDPVAVRGALERLVGDAALRATLGAAAKARADAQFTVEAMVERFERLLCGKTGVVSFLGEPGREGVAVAAPSKLDG